jgi:hypothetical protein
MESSPHGSLSGGNRQFLVQCWFRVQADLVCNVGSVYNTDFVYNVDSVCNAGFVCNANFVCNPSTLNVAHSLLVSVRK